MKAAPGDLFTSCDESLSDFGRYHRSRGNYYRSAPSNLGELRDLILQASERSVPLRVRGNGHSMNGNAVPREDEILLLTGNLRHYRFEEEATITVGAGAAIWDVHKMLSPFGYELLVYNDGGAAAASVGGYISAGGIGFMSWKYGGFWETVESVTYVTATGRIVRSRRHDELFPWLFGSMGQLAVFYEATLRIQAREGLEPAYPTGKTGLIEDSPAAWPQTLWYTAFVPKPVWGMAKRELAALGRRHRDLWQNLASYAYYLPFQRFTPPLIHPKQEDLVAVGIWGEAPAEGFNLQLMRELEQDFAGWLKAHPGYLRYAQSELLLEDFDYQAHFGPEAYGRLRAFKLSLDPRHLLGRGIVAPRRVAE